MGWEAASPVHPRPTLGAPAGPRQQPRRPGKASVITGAPGNVRGIFRAGSWPAWPPWELCLISPADVFDGMSAPRGAGVNPGQPCP